ncbi:restriction endonuclease subunit S [Aeromonas caviae]|uniref:restriction endonuclease subunit S n=1 Tax=Aeromonas caviae TaxID=648 RepID=UPI002B465117|nr:restriction endonuclease subunit S [Aeromonas caviae]
MQELVSIAEVSWGNTSTTKSSYVEHGYPAYSAAGNDGFVDFFEHEDNGIVLSAIGARCGRCFWAEGKWTAIKNTITITRKSSSDVSLKYLFYILNRPDIWPNRGGAQPFISLGDARKVLVPVPPLEEQKRIAAILDNADAIRQKRQQAIALADDFLRSVFLDMFGDPIMNPKGWELSTIGKLGNVITGSTPSSKKTGMFDGDIPFVTPGDLETDAPVSRTLTDEGALNSRTCRKGTTLVCCIGATIGKIGVASRTSAFNQQINAIEWGSEIDDEFGFFAMKLMKATIISSAIQTTLPILNKSAFSALVMYLPPKNLQMKFSKIYKSTYRLNGENKKFTINSNMLFDSLLQKSFSGQL